MALIDRVLRSNLKLRHLQMLVALEEGVNMLPGFSPELQGVYSETDSDGIKRLYGYVLNQAAMRLS